MKGFLSLSILISILLPYYAVAQTSTASYLQKNRYDLHSDFQFEPGDFKLFGFAAYHGSQKTEEAEIILLKKLLSKKSIQYYLPEVDFSMGYYFNEYLKNGDTLLLKPLVEEYGYRAPQESSISIYKKWQAVKSLNDDLPEEDKLQVVGVDCIVSNKYPIKLILELTTESNEWPLRDSLLSLSLNLQTNYSSFSNSESKELLKKWVADYEQHIDNYSSFIQDTFILNHVIQDIKRSFGKLEREPTIYENYIKLMPKYDFKKRPQFVRMGMFHVLKKEEKIYPSFFTRLINNNIHQHTEIVTVLGFLTKSTVLWNAKYDKNGKYRSYSIKRGYGIGDYWLEYFRGIKYLKKSKLSDLTLYKLTAENSPYFQKGNSDLVEVKGFFRRSTHEQYLQKSTTDFFDWALLISNSKANIPIEAMKP